MEKIEIFWWALFITNLVFAVLSFSALQGRVNFATALLMLAIKVVNQ